MQSDPPRLVDDSQLLDLMISDMHRADPLYRPTNFWGIREGALVAELKQSGLRDFRRRRGSHLASFGATDYRNPLVRFDLKALRFVNNRVVRRIPGYTRALDALSRCLTAAVIPRAGLSSESLPKLAHAFASQQAATAGYAKPLAGLSESAEGNPEEQFVTQGGARYSINFLNYYLMYAFASRHVDFDKIQTYAELGSGAGRQAEVIVKLHPKLTVMLFDIAPQLYVAEQYLKAVFGDRVVSYRDGRAFQNLADLSPGKIHMLGSWQLPLIASGKIDLFWNAASMQEMEPEVVGNYLSFVNRAADYVFLEAVMHGHHIARRPGQPGVLKKTLRSDYEAGLSAMSIIAEEAKMTCLGDSTVSTSDPGAIRYPTVSFWSRRKA